MKPARTIFLIASTILLAVLATMAHTETDLGAFLGGLGDGDAAVPDVASRRIVVLVGGESEPTSPEKLTETAETFAARIAADMVADSLTVTLDFNADERQKAVTDYLYTNLPRLLAPAEALALENATNPDTINTRLAQARNLMRGVGAEMYQELLPADPLGLGNSALRRLAEGADQSADSLYPFGDYLIDARSGRLVFFIDAPSDFADANRTADVVERLRTLADEVETPKIETNRPNNSPNNDSVNIPHKVRIDLTGGPVISQINTSRVFKDQMFTISLTLVLMALLIAFCYRGKRTPLLIVAPVVYGLLFVLAVVGVSGLRISALALGAGSAVMGIAFAYSIHVVTHTVRTADPRQITREMAPTMIVGSVTTVGAFVGLLFTHNVVLRHLGLFASLLLVGALFFSLVFLPYLLKGDETDLSGSDGGSAQTPKPLMSHIIKVAGYDFSRSRIAVVAVLALTAAGLFFMGSVRYNSNLADLGYRGNERQAEALLIAENLARNSSPGSVDAQLAATDMNDLAAKLALLQTESAFREPLLTTLLPPPTAQLDGVKAWQACITANARQIESQIRAAARNNGFNEEAFAPFYEKLAVGVNAEPIFPDDDELRAMGLLGNKIFKTDNGYLLLTTLATANDAEAERIAQTVPGLTITDLGYGSRRGQAVLIDDFNRVLWISSALVFVTLLLAYRHLLKTLMVFAPMCAAWVIILGLMAVFGVEFNIVNIILSTFIFGVGDDFSIFVMDGLEARRRGAAGLLTQHKTAIAVSALALIIGMGTQSLAAHPAIRGMGLLALFGLVAVVVCAFVVEPFLYRLFVSRPQQCGKPAWNARDLTCCVLGFGSFAVLCVLGNAVMLVLLVLPIGQSRKQNAMSAIMTVCMRFFYGVATFKYGYKNEGQADFSKPRVVVANHTSLLDIMAMYVFVPRLVFVTKSWVSRSPLFGLMTRYCGFYDVEAGSAEGMLSALSEYAKRGYSIVIFPEGTRSADGRLLPFKRGAVKLARQLNLKILPIVMHGNHKALGKRDPLHFSPFPLRNVFMPLQDPSITTSALREKMLAEWMRLDAQSDEQSNAQNIATNKTQSADQ